LTAHNASSSPYTLKIMLMVVLIFIPVVIGYQIWAYFDNQRPLATVTICFSTASSVLRYQHAIKDL
jgi:cytochrome bd-type quinol oxidase subunit 2